ncbi:hypothetical protein MKY59_21090 [Paenibacillus sp. FSL W8-0426]|uniref:hypothetical protein n=1 Tax=Paenibacillus sp. FSL W8-0426 TaxID=2921714 RepID=UPI0030D813E0
MFIHLADGSILDVSTLLSTKLTASDIAIPVDIQGVNLANPGEKLNVSLVDQDGKPVTIGGSSDNGTAMEFINTVNKVALRDALVKTVDMPDLSKYVRYDLYVLSTLDKPVRIAPWQGTSIVLEDGTIGVWELASDATNKLNYAYAIPAKAANGNNVFWLSELMPKSVDGGTILPQKPSGKFNRVNAAGAGGMKITYQTVGGAPTAGDLTIRVIGYFK